MRKPGWPSLLLAVLLPASLVDSGHATAADPKQGHLLARQWCASCHLVEPGGSAVDRAPPFATLANDPTLTPDRLRGWLAAPHPAMPDLSLTRLEIESIVSYIESLRRTP